MSKMLELHWRRSLRRLSFTWNAALPIKGAYLALCFQPLLRYCIILLFRLKEKPLMSTPVKHMQSFLVLQPQFNIQRTAWLAICLQLANATFVRLSWSVITNFVTSTRLLCQRNLWMGRVASFLLFKCCYLFVASIKSSIRAGHRSFVAPHCLSSMCCRRPWGVTDRRAEKNDNRKTAGLPVTRPRRCSGDWQRWKETSGRRRTGARCSRSRATDSEDGRQK